MRIEPFIIGTLIVIFVFVAFGATYISMATDKEHGYDVEVSSAFNSTYSNLSRSNALMGDMVKISYNMTDEMSRARATTAENWWDSVLASRKVYDFSVGSFDFVKTIVLQVSRFLGIPPIVFTLVTAIVLIGFVFAGIRLFFKVDL